MNDTFISDDYSPQFHQFRKSLMDDNGIQYLHFLKTLKPNFWIVWRDIALGYFAILFTIAALCFAGVGIISGLILAIIGAISIGYWVAYLILFIHEATHHNIANYHNNDKLASVTLCWLAGINIANYRRIHFGHHRLLGTCEDTENSYFNAPSVWFFFKTLTGLHALQILTRRNRSLASTDNKPRNIRPLLYSLTAHISLLSILLYYGYWSAMIAWILGIWAFFPFFSTLRQLLEHRDIIANPSINYQLEPHGAVSRMFGNNLFDATFGAAGFNRHMLHHWEPSISYTRLADLERFLLNTKFAPVIREARRYSYWGVLKELFQSSRSKLI